MAEDCVAALTIDTSNNFIWNVFIREDSRQKGLMTKLLKMILGWRSSYTLFVPPENIPAVNLYSKLGFVFIECDKMIYYR